MKSPIGKKAPLRQSVKCCEDQRAVSLRPGGAVCRHVCSADTSAGYRRIPHTGLLCNIRPERKFYAVVTLSAPQGFRTTHSFRAVVPVLGCFRAAPSLFVSACDTVFEKAADGT